MENLDRRERGGLKGWIVNKGKSEKIIQKIYKNEYLVGR